MNLRMKRREKFSKISIIIFTFFLIWILLQFLAPLALPSESISKLDGTIGFIDNQKKNNNMKQISIIRSITKI